MSDVIKTLLKITSILFAMLLLAFTGYQTWSLLYELTRSPIISALGLVVFEGGMLFWWLTFQNSAKGLGQMGLSFGMFLVDMFLVGTATALHLGAVDVSSIDASIPAQLVTAAVIINLVAKMFMPILDPEKSLSIRTAAAEGKIIDHALKRLETKATDMAEELAQTLSDDMLHDMREAILTGRKRPNLIEGEASLVTKNGDRQPLTAFEPIHLSDNGNGKEVMSFATNNDLPNSAQYGSDASRPFEVIVATPNGPPWSGGTVGTYNEAKEHMETLARNVPPNTNLSIYKNGRQISSRTTNRPDAQEQPVGETPDPLQPNSAPNGRSTPSS